MTFNQFNFKGKRALVRVDFNVPIDTQGNITDNTRILGAMPTLKKIIADGGAPIIISHMGKPKGKPNEKLTLKQIIPEVQTQLGAPVHFAPDCANAQKEAQTLPMGQALLLENLRFHPEEEQGEQQFAQQLASYADCYVNDAFGTAHRQHASTATVAQYFDKQHKMLGLLMEKEVKAVDNILNNIRRPFTAIMGGSKVSTKIGIIENLLTKVDNLILCGGMTYTFQKAMGGKIGASICENDKLQLALDILQKAKDNNVNLILGNDTIAADRFDNNANTQICPNNNIPDQWMGMDIGPQTQQQFAKAIETAQTILWNGPAGVFEMDNFAQGSKAIAYAIAKATQKGAYSLIGGGDSVACINKFQLADKVSYISTGGGALLEAIEGKKLPGVEAILG